MGLTDKEETHTQGVKDYIVIQTPREFYAQGNVGILRSINDCAVTS